MKKFYHALLLTLSCLFVLFNPTNAQTSNWSSVGPVAFPTNNVGQINGIARVSEIKFDPVNSNRIYAVAPHGLFVSQDNANSWKVLAGTENMVSGLSLASVCIDRTNNNTLYLGTGDANYYSSGSGVWKSTDGGTTFAQSNSGMGNRLVLEIVMSPTDNNVLVASTNAGIYKSTNAGASWVLTSPAVETSDMRMNAAPGSTTIYAMGRTNGVFYKSTDMGSTWTSQTVEATAPGNGARLAVTPANTNIVYLTFVGSNTTTAGGIVYRSTDGGTTFTLQKGDTTPNLNGYSATSSGQGNYNYDIEADPNNANTLYVCGHLIWKSTDGGVTWEQMVSSWAVIIHTDMHGMRFNPYNTSQLFNVNDGGVWVNTDGTAKTWTPKSHGLSGTEFYHMANSTSSKYMIGGGLQDNGEVFFNNGTWYCNRGGDWSSNYYFDKFNTNKVIYVENGTRRDLLSGSSLSLGLPNTATNSNRYTFSLQSANVAFVAQSTFGIYATANLQSNPPTWTKIYNSANTFLALANSPVDANIVYALSNNKSVVRSTNALNTTPTFTTVASAPMPSGTPSTGSLAVLKSGIVYMSSGGYVYRSADQGTTWATVGSGAVTSSLNSQNIQKIIADSTHSATESLYALTSKAVFYKDNTMTDWAYFTSNLPSIANLTDLDIFYDTSNLTNSLLRVSSFGRGVWESPLANNVVANQSPTVTITSPLNNVQCNIWQNVSINATANDVGGFVSKVEFYQGGIKIGEDFDAPFSFNWISSVAGTFPITAKAYDNTGLTTVSNAINIVAIVGACSGTTEIPRANLSIFSFDSQQDATGNAAINAIDGNTATIWHTKYSPTTAALPHEIQISLGGSYSVNSFKYTPRQDGTNGRVAQYEIYVSTDGSNWGTPVATGTFANDGSEKTVSFLEKTGSYLRFRALSEVIGQQFTTAAEIKVGFCNSNSGLSVAVSAPANNAVIVGSPVTINANAANTNGPISKVEFYQGTTLLGTSTTAPYNFTWSNAAAGSYAIVAKAIDNNGASITSSAINITVNATPTISISSPANNAIAAINSAVTINTNVNDADGTVTKVEFYQGTTKLGEDSAAPFSFNWISAIAGSFPITAVAFDNAGASVTSGIINVTFVTCPIDIPQANLKVVYFDSQQGGAEANMAIDGSTSTIWHTLWSPSVASLPHEIQLSLGGAYNVNRFKYTPRQDGSGNGRVGQYEIYVSTDGTTWGTPVATGTFANDASEKVVTFTDKIGSYVRFRALSEVNGQQFTTASEIKIGGCPVSAPTISITSPTDNFAFSSGANINIAANASDADGTIAKVEFYHGTTLLGQSTTAPYNFNWNDVPAGSYAITAKATDNGGLTTTSATVNITISAANIAPTVAITSPTNNASFTAGTNVNIAANASDADGAIAKVEFYQGTTLLGQSTTAPYSFSWSNVTAGNYAITVKATDNGGLTTTSATVNITVNAANIAPTVAITSPTNNASFTAGTNVNIATNASDADGAIAKVEFYHGTTLLGQSTTAPYSFSWNNVTAGNYAITAKATDNGGLATTSAIINIIINAAPTVAITSPANNASFVSGANVNILANASDADGTITKVEFYQGNTLLGQSTTAPYSFNWNNVTAGNYAITAKATDNSNATTTSAIINIAVNAAPTVAITSPANNATFTAGGNVNITANANDADGTITKVEFYQGTTLLGQSTTAPYSFNWNNVTAGNYAITAKATDNSNATTTSAIINIAVNAAPTVAITSPANNATFTAGGNVNITANASDADGTITKVEFYQGNTLLGQSTTAPYSFNWNNVTAGNYAITAKATDNSNVVTTSAVANITVNIACTNTYEPNNSKTAAVAIPLNTDIQSQIATSTDIDWYKFTLSATSNIQVLLQNLPADYDIYVYKSNSNSPIGSSINGSTTPELISINNLASGTYYIKVIGYNGVSSTSICYLLNVNNSSSPTMLVTDPQPSNKVVDQSSSEMKVIVYPNPTKENYKLMVESKDNQTEVIISVSDISGKIVKTIKTIPNQTIQFGSDLGYGTYVLQAKQGTKLVTMKLSKL